MLALAESPAFDPNRFMDVAYPETRSRSFHDAFEPGSTLKAFLVAGALDAGAITTDTILPTAEGKLRVPGKLITDHWSPVTDHRSLTWGRLVSTWTLKLQSRAEDPGWPR